jgi:hypothetical protein
MRRPLFAALSMLLACVGEAQLLVRIPDREGPIHDHAVTSWSPSPKESPIIPALWIAFDDGLHVVREHDDASTSVSGVDCATSIAAAGDAVWVACASSESVRVIERGATHPVPIDGVEGRLVYAKGNAERGLIVTTRTIYSVIARKATELAVIPTALRALELAKKGRASHWSADPLRIVTVGTPLSEQVILVSSRTLIRTSSSDLTAETLAVLDTDATSIAAVGDTIFIGTTSGLKRLAIGAGNELVADADTEPVQGVAAWNGTLYIARAGRLQTLTGDTVTDLDTIGTKPREFEQLIPTDDGEFLAVAADQQGRDHLYVVTDKVVGEPKKILSEIPLPNGLTSIYSVVSTQAMRNPTNGGDSKSGSEVKQTPVRVNYARFVSGNVGSFFARLSSVDVSWRELLEGNRLSDAAFVDFDGAPWFLSERGAYRFDEYSTIHFDVKRIQPSWWRDVVEGTFPGIRLSGLVKPTATYRTTTQTSSPYPEQFGGAFRCAVDEKLSADSALLPVEPGAAASGTYFELSPGSRPRYRVVDRWGNRVEDSLPGFVVWSGPVLAMVVVAAWILSLAMLLALAPKSLLCHMILMNRHVRRFGYFNLVPVIVVVGPVRRHLLRRYVDSISNEYDSWKERYVVPSPVMEVSRTWPLLKEHRKLLLHGSSGVGKTAYLHYLAAVFSKDSNALPADARRLVPVFVPLSRYRGQPPDDMVHSQLRKFGLVTDPEIARVMVESGGFLILLDGLNEVERTTRDNIRSFVDAYSGRGSCLFVVTSQDDDVELGAVRLDVPLLDKKGIEKILRSRLSADLAKDAIDHLDDRACQLLQLPQDLDLVIDLFDRLKAVKIPVSRRELYDRVFDGVRAKWSAADEIHLWDVLCARTYEALVKSERRVSIADQQAIRENLRSLRLLVEREGELSFRHEQIHAYVAAQYIAPRWRELVQGKKTDEEKKKNGGQVEITFAWLPTLLFVASIVPEGEVGEFFERLLATERFVAEAVYKLWVRTDPDADGRSATWIADFQRQVGAAALAS